MATRLDNGVRFPAIEAPAVGGGMVSLPDDVAGHWAVVLFYRGHWCPFCRAQLSAFQRSLGRLDELGVRVVALSVDNAEQARETVDRGRLTFPVAYGVDPDDVADRYGAYAHRDPAYLESTNFVLAQDGSVFTAVYSSNAIGRLAPDDVIGQIQHAQQQVP